MPRLRLICWNAGDARDRATLLRRAGYTVQNKPLAPRFLTELRKSPPAAVVIDLTWMPSQGRDVALAIHESASLRTVPLVFAGGEPGQVARIRKLLPNARTTPWARVRSAVRVAIADPPAASAPPVSRMAGYSGTPLPKKLGIARGAAVALIRAPEEFEETLGPLPEQVRLRRGARGRADVAIWFVRSVAELTKRIDAMARLAGAGRLWIAWPKKASGVETDVTQTIVRRSGLDRGLVDYKICAIDGTWSGLCFTRRKER